MLIDEGLELLDELEAWALLQTADVGRVGLTMGALPVILPVNFTVLDGAIVFRTAPGSKVEAASRQAVVAFEVDDYDTAERTGWSVLVIGRSEVVHDLSLTFALRDAGLEPLADGQRGVVVRIRPEIVTGRRIARSGEASAG
jgi:nitroimidazol reductase NimA-like FMN-containing flavoprotein (pyridoxamine 5'-phosphate oxidase superfamily)